MITLLGTSAGAVAFQAYLVEGLARWNRERALQERGEEKLRSFDITLMHRVNALSTSIYGEAALANFSTPSPYTKEVIGVKYLRLQTGDCPDAAVQDLDREIDEAFGEFEMGSDEEEGDSRTDETVAHPEDSGDSGNEVISK